MSKERDALVRISKGFFIENNDLRIVETALIALEIINNLHVNIGIFKQCNVDYETYKKTRNETIAYNEKYGDSVALPSEKELAKEEFDLLNEVSV